MKYVFSGLKRVALCKSSAKKKKCCTSAFCILHIERVKWNLTVILISMNKEMEVKKIKYVYKKKSMRLLIPLLRMDEEDLDKRLQCEKEAITDSQTSFRLA